MNASFGEKLLIIGGVAAGATAAARARRLNGDVEITVLEAGDDVSFANCGLPYFIGGDIEYRSALILASPETFHDQYRVNVRVNTEALEIDRRNRVVHTRNSRTGEESSVPYDRLILAQGGKPIAPPIPGADREHVFQLWTLDDMDAIDTYIERDEPRSAVVVGGGFIGLEMVEALAKRGLDVHLVELAPQIMPNLEGEIAGFLTKELQDYGVALHLGTSIEAIDDKSVVLSDGTSVTADMVVLSVGVRPTLALAKTAGLEIGPAGGLAVDEHLRTSDERIFAAGDMVEIRHALMGRTVRIPLAGPANRQGRIAAENALGGNRAYRGAMATSIVKLFGAVAGSTGLGLSTARDLGLPAEAIVVHKASHTAYYPGSDKVTLQLVFDSESGLVLGAQAAGRVGVDKRLDVISTAIAGNLTVGDLQELDLAYAPPFNSPNGPVNMAAFAAENHRTRFSRSVLARDVEAFIVEREPVVIDVRDPLQFNRANLHGANNISPSILRDNLDRVPRDDAILLISDDGQKGHVAARMLAGAGFDHVSYVSGGYISMERHARAIGYERLLVGLFAIEEKSIEGLGRGAPDEAKRAGDDGETPDDVGTEGPITIDVRTPMEYQMGAYPGAINILLDELPQRIGQLADPNREIVLYCASGARSAYGVRLLEQMGYRNVTNGGGIHDMMAR